MTIPLLDICLAEPFLRLRSGLVLPYNVVFTLLWCAEKKLKIFLKKASKENLAQSLCLCKVRICRGSHIMSKKPAMSDEKTDEDYLGKNLPLKRQQKRTMMRKFDEDLMIGGLGQIYNEFPHSAKFRGRGFEAADIRSLMKMYKEWAFQLHPGVDVLTSCETIGNKPKVRQYMENLRQEERKRYFKEVLTPHEEVKVDIR